MNVDPRSNKSSNISLLGLSGMTFTLEARANHVIDAGSAKRSSEVPSKATT